MVEIRQIRIAVIILFFVFIAHFISPIIISWDSAFCPYVTLSIVREGNTDLDEYNPLLEINKKELYAVQKINGHYYSIYPIGTPIIATPVVFILDKIFHFNYKKANFVLWHEFIQRVAAGLIVSMTASLVYLIAAVYFKGIFYPTLLTFIFSFCTSAWSVASRALWQHGPSMLMLTVVLYLVILAKHKPWLIRFLGLPLVLAYVIRPTNIVSVALFTCFVFLEYKRYFLSYLLWVLVSFMPFLFYNLSIYRALLPSYYSPAGLGSNRHFIEALAGNFFSPSRGIFIFSPVLLFSLFGVYLKFKNKALERLDYTLVTIIILHWLIISSYVYWQGNWSIGNRYFSDLMPFFIYFLMPVFLTVSRIAGLKKIALVSFFFIFTVLSFSIHYRCVTDPGVTFWNISAEKSDSKVWDWRDIQFMRGIDNK